MAFDQILFREKELLKLNTELNNKAKLLLNNLPQKNNQNEVKKTSPKPFKKHKILQKSIKNNDSLEMQKQSESSKDSSDVTATFINHNYSDESLTDIFSRVTSNQPENPQQIVSSRSNKHGTTNGAISDKLIKRNITTDGLIRYLKGKVILLQDELESTQKDNLKKTNDLTVSMELQKKSEHEHEQLLMRNQQLRNQVTKLEEVKKSNELRIKEYDKEMKTIARELEQLKRYVHTLSHTNMQLDRRFQKIQEELDKSKCNLTEINNIEKETREKFRQEREMYEKQIKQLRRHRYDLLAAYKKQLLLLDNLKRQVTCAEQSKLIDIAEKEFTKILDWNKK